MPGLIVRVISLPVGSPLVAPAGPGFSRSRSAESFVAWRHGQSVGALAQAIRDTSVMAMGANIEVLQFHDEATARPNTCLERIHGAGSADGAGLDQLVRMCKPGGVAINFSISSALAALLSQGATPGTWTDYLLGLASRVRGTITVTRAGNRLTEIRCPVPRF